MAYFKKKLGLAIIGICFLVLLVGCGNNNIFKSLVGDTHPLGTVEEKATYIKEQSKKGNYQDVIPVANSIISSNATAAQKVDAYASKGVAILGKTGFNEVKVANDLLSNNSSLDASILKRLPVVSTADAIQSAIALNQAAALASNNALVLDKGAQLTRGLANVSVISAKINDAYDVSSSGNITLKEGTNSKDALEQLLAVDSTGNNILDYAKNAQEGIDKGANLTSDQRDQVDKVKNIPDDLQSLNKAVHGTGPDYTYPNPNVSDLEHPNITISSHSSDSDVQAATTYIIQKANR